MNEAKFISETFCTKFKLKYDEFELTVLMINSF